MPRPTRKEIDFPSTECPGPPSPKRPEKAPQALQSARVRRELNNKALLTALSVQARILPNPCEEVRSDVTGQNCG